MNKYEVGRLVLSRGTVKSMIALRPMNADGEVAFRRRWREVYSGFHVWFASARHAILPTQSKLWKPAGCVACCSVDFEAIVNLLSCS